MVRAGRTKTSEFASQPRPHRLAVVIVKAARGPDAPRILIDLGRTGGAAGSTVRMWCRVAKLYPHDVVAFARALFAVLRALERGVYPHDLLDFAEQRSLERLLERSGPLAIDGRPVSLQAFCAQHQFISPRQILADVIRLITA